MPSVPLAGALPSQLPAALFAGCYLSIHLVQAPLQRRRTGPISQKRTESLPPPFPHFPPGWIIPNKHSLGVMVNFNGRGCSGRLEGPIVLGMREIRAGFEGQRSWPLSRPARPVPAGLATFCATFPKIPPAGALPCVFWEPGFVPAGRSPGAALSEPRAATRVSRCHDPPPSPGDSRRTRPAAPSPGDCFPESMDNFTARAMGTSNRRALVCRGTRRDSKVQNESHPQSHCRAGEGIPRSLPDPQGSWAGFSPPVPPDLGHWVARSRTFAVLWDLPASPELLLESPWEQRKGRASLSLPQGVSYPHPPSMFFPVPGHGVVASASLPSEFQEKKPRGVSRWCRHLLIVPCETMQPPPGFPWDFIPLSASCFPPCLCPAGSWHSWSFNSPAGAVHASMYRPSFYSHCFTIGSNKARTGTGMVLGGHCRE